MCYNFVTYSCIIYNFVIYDYFSKTHLHLIWQQGGCSMRKYFEKKDSVLFLFLGFCLTALIAYIAYVSGGSNTSATSLMSLAVITVSATNRKIIGIIHALISGISIGPILPLYVDMGIPQEPVNWIVRTLYLISVSLIVNYFAHYYIKEFEKNHRIEKEISQSNMATIYALIKLSESRDDETGTHVERVSQLCKLLAIKMKSIPKYCEYITEDYIENLWKASMLHDIGKVGIPDNILLKPGKLTSEEFEVIKQHPIIGSHVLSEIYDMYPNNSFLKLGYSIVHFHHEKWDGSGYPSGISKDSIPLSARIMAIVDVYDALRSKRIYKEAYTHEDSIKIVKEGKGTHFDPEITDIFIDYAEEFRDTYDNVTSTPPKVSHLNEMLSYPDLNLPSANS